MDRGRGECMDRKGENVWTEKGGECIDRGRGTYGHRQGERMERGRGECMERGGENVWIEGRGTYGQW